MTNYLSYSASEKYKLCSEKYRLHYIEKLRYDKLSSAFLFGSAIDEALNCLLLSKKKDLTDEELKIITQCPMDIMATKLQIVNINGVDYNTLETDKIEFYKSDVDIDLFSKDQLEYLFSLADGKVPVTKYTELLEFVEKCQQEKTIKNTEWKSFYNILCLESLKAKGKMILESYAREVIPLIHEVHSVQEKMEMNDNGDILGGLIDFTCSFKDDPNKIYVVDNKTASKRYKDDSVRTSVQLATYAAYKNTNNAAYIVMEKNIRKYEPRVRLQVIKDTIPEAMMDKAFDELSASLHGIKNKQFAKNFDSCYTFGRQCEYYNLCRGRKQQNLVSVKKEEINESNNE